MWGADYPEYWAADEEWGYAEGTPLAQPCRNGPSCRFLALGTCMYSHGEQDYDEDEAWGPEAAAPALVREAAQEWPLEAAAPGGAAAGKWNVLVNSVAADAQAAAQPPPGGARPEEAGAARGGASGGAAAAGETPLGALKALLRKGAERDSDFSWRVRARSRSPRRERERGDAPTRLSLHAGGA